MRISVRGTSSTTTPPDLGVLSLAVAVEGRDRSAAFDAARAATQAAVAVVTPDGEADRLVVSPVSVYTTRPQATSGKLQPEVHRASSTVRAAFRNVETLSRVAAELGRARYITLTQIGWELTEDTARRVAEEQTAAAVRDAVRRAQVMAEAAGAGEVRVVEIADPGLLSESRDGFGAPAGAMMRASFDGGEESLDPEFLQIVPRPVPTAITVEVRCEA